MRSLPPCTVLYSLTSYWILGCSASHGSERARFPSYWILYSQPGSAVESHYRCYRLSVSRGLQLGARQSHAPTLPGPSAVSEQGKVPNLQLVGHQHAPLGLPWQDPSRQHVSCCTVYFILRATHRTCGSSITNVPPARATVHCNFANRRCHHESPVPQWHKPEFALA